jgi:hypothetical protein
MNRTTHCAAVFAVMLACLCAVNGRGADEQTSKPKAGEQQAKEGQPIEKKEEDKKAGDNRAVKKAKMAVQVMPPPSLIHADAPNDAMVQQWIQQYRPYLLTELNFIRQMCDLPKEQRPKIKAAGEAGLREAATKFAKTQQRRQGIDVSQFSPRTIIRQALEQALKETLTEEQMARYTAEAAARTAQHKRAVILSVVSRLEGALCLTGDQREEITKTLTSNWQDKWESWLTVHQYGDLYFPQVPDQNIVPCLNEQQRSVWSGFQKIVVNQNVGPAAQQLDDAEWWGDLPEKRAPEFLKALGDLFGGHR